MHLVPVQKHRAPTQQLAFKPTVFSLEPLKLTTLKKKWEKISFPVELYSFWWGWGALSQMGESILQWALDQVQCLVSPEMKR